MALVMPLPALPSLPMPASSATHALGAAAGMSQNAWSAGAKDVAPLFIVLNYAMLGNGLTDTWVATFLLLAAIFAFFNMLQDSKPPAPAPLDLRQTQALEAVERRSWAATARDLTLLLPPDQRRT